MKKSGLIYDKMLSLQHVLSKFSEKDSTEQDTSEISGAGKMLSYIICNCFLMSGNKLEMKKMS